MTYFKIILPALLIAAALTGLTIYYDQFAASVQNALQFMPHVLGTLVIILSIYFNQARPFYLAILILTYVLFSKQLLLSDLWTVNVTLLWAGFALLTLGLLRERGLIALSLVHLLLLLSLACVIGWVNHTKEPATSWLLQPWLPGEGFSWLTIAHIPFVFYLLVVCLLLIHFFRQPSNGVFNTWLISIIVVVLFNWQASDTAMIISTSGALLLLLVSSVQHSWHLAYTDELTNLPGRRALEEKLKRSLGIYALAMVDVDHFKKFNDKYGHDVGDDVLRMIANQLKAVPGGGQAYRYGGEEFTIIFSHHGADEVKQHLETVRKKIAEIDFVVNRRQTQKPQTTQVTISIGLTDSINHKNSEQTIKKADQALYQAKKKGRNRTVMKA